MENNNKVKQLTDKMSDEYIKAAEKLIDEMVNILYKDENMPIVVVMYALSKLTAAFLYSLKHKDITFDEMVEDYMGIVKSILDLKDKDKK